MPSQLEAPTTNAINKPAVDFRITQILQKWPRHSTVTSTVAREMFAKIAKLARVIADKQVKLSTAVGFRSTACGTGKYNTICPHSAMGYRPPAPEAIQPDIKAATQSTWEKNFFKRGDMLKLSYDVVPSVEAGHKETTSTTDAKCHFG